MLDAGPLLGPGNHSFVDFGDDAYTVGRPHPMIDPSLRSEHLLAALDEPACTAVLLDVVLGLGAHPDPAGELAPLVERAAKPVVVSLIGTDDDPQGLRST